MRSSVTVGDTENDRSSSRREMSPPLRSPAPVASMTLSAMYADG